PLAPEGRGVGVRGEASLRGGAKAKKAVAIIRRIAMVAMIVVVGLQPDGGISVSCNGVVGLKSDLPGFFCDLGGQANRRAEPHDCVSRTEEAVLVPR
ncbi:MAG: hypothetical protein WAK53_12315, partial [Chromatiaceae bacterium]